MEERSEAEQRLASHGITIEGDFPAGANPEHNGCAVICEAEGGISVRLVIRPDQDSLARATFAEWAESRLDRFLEHGPEPDGWQRRSDGGWQMWTRLVNLGDLDDPEGP